MTGAWRAQRVRFAQVARLCEALDCPEPLAWTLVRRGLAEPEAAREFLAADGPLEPPEAIPGIADAAERLVRAVRGREEIVVHGDYDCDGITSTAILVQALRERGARVRAFLPSRFTDGYGVNPETVERLAEEGCDVLVCVDCGTTAVEPLTRARELGIDAIVCDHHLAGGARPPAILANPALGRGSEALPAAAGVTFKLVQALSARLDGGRLAPPPEDALDLVALATVADAVPLVGENRRLVARGLSALRSAPRPGLAALCDVGGLATRAVTARTLGFQLAPCINASGRMAHPEQALELLLTADRAEARPIAEKLWALNLERREVERQVTAEAVAVLDAGTPEERGAGALVAAGEGWHEGVVGIVASRLVERFGRPAIVIARDGDTAKGSGRSVPGVDLHALVGSASTALTRWGGHAGAVGLQLAADDVAAFRRDLSTAAESVREAIRRSQVKVVDAVVGIHDLGLQTAEALEQLAPFGRGNPEVRLVVPGCAATNPRAMGEEGRHLEVRLRAGEAHTRAVGFGQGERAAGVEALVRYDALVELGVERWQDLVGPKVVLGRLEPVSAPSEPARGLCHQACDIACRERAAGASLRDRLLDPFPEPPPAPTSEPPVGLRDRRGEGAALALLAALAGADGGAVALVGDVARRRPAMETVLEPRRLGIDVAVLASERCDGPAMRARLGLARGGPLLAMADYPSLPELDLPEGAHLVLVDPPCDRRQLDWTLSAAAGRWLHLAYSAGEIAFVEAICEFEWELRPHVAAIWRALRERGSWPWGAALEAALLGDGPTLRPPSVSARALAVLSELGLVHLDEGGLRPAGDPPRRELSESPSYRRALETLAGRRAFLERALTLDFEGSAISYEYGQAAG